jgi:hypothetical protein
MSRRVVDIVSPSTEEELIALAVAVDSGFEAAIRAVRDTFDVGHWPRHVGAEARRSQTGTVVRIGPRENGTN